jgi:hypothetical protein
MRELVQGKTFLMENAMSNMTQTMTGAGAKESSPTAPKQGDHFRCEECGMEIAVTTGCKCADGKNVQFQCCGQNMAKV